MTLRKILVCGMLVLFLFPEKGSCLSERFFNKYLAEANRTFRDSLLFEQEAVSEVHCALLCWSTPGCKCSTATATVHYVTCRGHSQVMTSAVTRIHTPWTSYLVQDESDWWQRRCHSDGECGATWSQCLDGVCVCTAGYYYSHSNDTCIEDCSTADLTIPAQVYPGFKINGRNIGDGCYRTSYDQCMSACVRYQGCRTYDFYSPDKTSTANCCLQGVTRLDVSESSVSYGEVLHYQMSCL